MNFILFTFIATAFLTAVIMMDHHQIMNRKESKKDGSDELARSFNNQNDDSHNRLLEFLEEYLPDYYTDSDVCTLNILYKYLDKEELSSEDEEFILESFKSKEEIIEEVKRIEVDLFQEAVKEYYKQQYLN